MDPRTDPTAIAGAFVARCMEEPDNPGAAHDLVVPGFDWERCEAEEWRAQIETIILTGGGLRPAERAAWADDVAYGLVAFRETLDAPDGSLVVNAGRYVSLVWRPELGSWLVAAVGAQVHPDELLRTSPDVAPEAER